MQQVNLRTARFILPRNGGRQLSIWEDIESRMYYCYYYYSCLCLALFSAVTVRSDEAPTQDKTCHLNVFKWKCDQGLSAPVAFGQLFLNKAGHT